MADAVQWAQCERCEKWRVVEDPDSLPEVWYCEMNEDDGYNHCQVPEQQFPSSTASAGEAAQPASAGRGRGGAGRLAPEVELENMLKTWPIDKLKELWLSFDWAAMVEARKPPKPPKQAVFGGTNIDDRAFVKSVDATVRKALPKTLSLQTPPLVSLWEQQQALLRQLAQEQ